MNYKPGDAIRVVACDGGPDFRGMTGHVVQEDAETLERMTLLFRTPVLRVSLEQTGNQHFLPARILASNAFPPVTRRRKTR